jgi:hypothetical protein
MSGEERSGASDVFIYSFFLAKKIQKLKILKEE